MCSRYSSRVVAPTYCSSPRVSMGHHPGSKCAIAPSAAPAPTTLCSSSMNSTTSLARMISSRAPFRRLLQRAAVLGAGHHGAEVENQHALAAQGLGHVAGDDLLGEALGDGGVLPTPGSLISAGFLARRLEHLDDALDLGVAADDRVEPALDCERSRAGLLEHALAGGVAFVVDAGVAESSARACRRLSSGHAEVLQHRGARAVALEEDAAAKVLGADGPRRPSLLGLLRAMSIAALAWGVTYMKGVGEALDGPETAGAGFCAELVGARLGRAKRAQQVEGPARRCRRVGRSTPISRCSVPSTGPRRTTPGAVSSASRARSENLLTSIAHPLSFIAECVRDTQRRRLPTCTIAM